MITLNEYQAEALRTWKDRGELTLPYLGLSIAGEAGEVVEIIKKHVGHGRPLNYEHLREELGDVLWGIAVLARELGSDLSEIAALNCQKLRKRYPEGFVENSGKPGP